MKKILIAVLALGVFALVATSVQAEEKYVAGGFEASGHVMTGAGFQHVGKKTPGFATTYQITDGDRSYGPGPIGAYTDKALVTGANAFNFFVDEVELDIAKSFGENIRARADLDFTRVGSGTYGSGLGTPTFILEQAYATANIPLGNGVEFLLGRFNAPIGFESVDASENDTISKSLMFGLRPASSLTGLKLYYSFSDLIDLHFYVVNNLWDNTLSANGAFPTAKNNTMPSFGFRLGFNWGEEGSESTVGVSGLIGPAVGTSNKHYMFGGDLDFNWWITESFALGGEVNFSRANALLAPAGAVDKQTALGGLLNLHYVFSDVWDGTLKYAFGKQYKGTNLYLPFGVAARESVQQAALAGGYAVADGAKLKLEGRMDIVKPSVGGFTQYIYGGAVAFAYDF